MYSAACSIVRSDLLFCLQSGSPQVSAKIPHTQVTVSFLQTDITESQCEAIVNASNEDLELRSAGVSGSILEKGIARSLTCLTML